MRLWLTSLLIVLATPASTGVRVQVGPPREGPPTGYHEPERRSYDWRIRECYRHNGQWRHDRCQYRRHDRDEY